MTAANHRKRGISPLKAFFATLAGCIGVENIAGICSAIQIGGPGALFWVWVTAVTGMVVKYSEVYLGLHYRKTNDHGGYDGGPMYFLKKAFNARLIPAAAACFLCIYGVDVYQFNIVVTSVSANLAVHEIFIGIALLGLIIFAALGGLKRVSTIASVITPAFVFVYLAMGIWILAHHISQIPAMFAIIFKSAFTGSAAIGGFVGSTFLLALSRGVCRGCYISDLGTGYASVIYSESNEKNLQEQASLVIVDVFLNAFLISTTSVMIVLVTGVWQQPLNAVTMMQTALSGYFPYMHVFLPIFLLLLGYSTITTYFCVGIKCAEYLFPSKGKILYYCYASILFLSFLFFGVLGAQSLMMIVTGFLVIINCIGIFKLRHHISFNLPKQAEETPDHPPLERFILN